MRKFILAAALAVAALVGFSSAANAATLNPGGGFSAASTAALTFSGPLGITTSCDLTLTGTLATSGNIGDNVGSVTGSTLANCRNPTSTLLGTAWTITLNALNGSPITSADVTLGGVGFEVTLLGVRCLYGGSVPLNITNSTPRGASNVITVGANSLRSTSGGICGSGSLNAGQRFLLSPGQQIS